MKYTVEDLTPEQAQALTKYAVEKGRFWKANLRSDWSNGHDNPCLRQIRNQFGPEWLNKFKFI